jgi:hypothetical protein
MWNIIHKLSSTRITLIASMITLSIFVTLLGACNCGLEPEASDPHWAILYDCPGSIVVGESGVVHVLIKFPEGDDAVSNGSDFEYEGWKWVSLSDDGGRISFKGNSYPYGDDFIFMEVPTGDEFNELSPELQTLINANRWAEAYTNATIRGEVSGTAQINIEQPVTQDPIIFWPVKTDDRPEGAGPCMIEVRPKEAGLDSPPLPDDVKPTVEPPLPDDVEPTVEPPPPDDVEPTVEPPPPDDGEPTVEPQEPSPPPPNITINFDELKGIPEGSSARIPSDQYLSQGVIISRIDPVTDDPEPSFVAVQHLYSGNGAHSLPYSVAFGYKGANVQIRFVDPDTEIVAVTNYVSAWVGDKSSERDPITMTAYDLDGTEIGSASYTAQPSSRLDDATDFGFVEISAEGIHRVVFTDDSSSGGDFDDLTFSPPVLP